MASRIKRLAKARLPGLFDLWRRLKPATGVRSAQQTFTRKFHKHGVLDRDSLSGPGSDLEQTRAIRDALPGLLQTLQCRTLLDVPCGDFYWMKHVKADVAYIGGDIVAELIERNCRVFADPSRRFVQIDLRADSLPAADVLLCRDCLVHFSNADVARALANVRRSACTYLLTTTFASRTRNDDIPTGKWRPINLERAPFSLPAPLLTIDEAHPSPAYCDKQLALWRVADLPRSESPPHCASDDSTVGNGERASPDSR